MKKILLIALLAAVAAGTVSCCRTCRRAKPAEVKGVKWELIELQGKVIDRSTGQNLRGTYTLTLGDDGRIGGRGGCNVFFAAYTLDGNRIEISPIGSTRMLCPDPELESSYFRMLESAAKISVDGDFLILTDREGSISATFRKAEVQE